MTKETFTKAKGIYADLKDIDEIEYVENAEKFNIYDALRHVTDCRAIFLIKDVEGFLQIVKAKCKTEKERLIKELEKL